MGLHEKEPVELRPAAGRQEPPKLRPGIWWAGPCSAGRVNILTLEPPSACHVFGLSRQASSCDSCCAGAVSGACLAHALLGASVLAAAWCHSCVHCSWKRLGQSCASMAWTLAAATATTAAPVMARTPSKKPGRASTRSARRARPRSTRLKLGCAAALLHCCNRAKP